MEGDKRTAVWYNKQIQGLFLLLKEKNVSTIDTTFIFNRLNDIMSEKGLLLHRNIMKELEINSEGNNLHKIPYDPKSPIDARAMLLKGYQLYVDKNGVKWWLETVYSKGK